MGARYEFAFFPVFALKACSLHIDFFEPEPVR